MKKNKKSGKFRLLRNLILLILLIIIVISFITIKSGYDMYKSATAKISLDQKVQEIKSEKYYTTSQDIPKDFKNAIVAIEDHRFYQHGAFDIISIGRSAITDIKNLSLVEGGSTLTQQLAKNMYFSQEKKFSRKIAEIFVALDLEKNYSKDEILELYINIAYYGNGYAGIGQASRGYFSKLPSNLSLYEQTLLAGLPNAPSAYALNSKNSGLAKQRQSDIIDAMSKYNYLTDVQVKELKNEN